MADTWTQYFGGTDEQLDADRLRRQREYEELTRNATYQAMGRMGDDPVKFRDGRYYDPREVRMAMAADTLYPSPNTDFTDDVSYAGGKAWDGLSTAYSAAFEAGMRPRDTLIKAAQAYNAGDGWKAAELAARSPLAALYPPAAAGTPGSPDDWREDARQLGMGEGNILAVDLLTDPETYLPIPIPFMAAGKIGRAVKPALRYGSKARLFDEAGEAVRQLRMAR